MNCTLRALLGMALLLAGCFEQPSLHQVPEGSSLQQRTGRVVIQFHTIGVHPDADAGSTEVSSD